MASVNFTQGLKNAGDRVSAVSGFPTSIGAMGFDDSSTAFVNTSTSHSPGSPTNFFGKALDSTPTGGTAATPYIVTHLCTLTTGEFNGVTIRRVALHNKATAPTVSDTTIAFGVDGFSLAKTSAFSLITSFKLSYT